MPRAYGMDGAYRRQEQQRVERQASDLPMDWSPGTENAASEPQKDKKMKLVNLTPHAIVLQSADGARTTIPPSGIVPRVSSVPGVPERVDGVPVPVVSPQTWTEIIDLPPTEPGTLYIVSMMVLSRLIGHAAYLAPGTGPNDGAIRNDKGQVEAVTRLVRG